jgi:hypothetical protein
MAKNSSLSEAKRAKQDEFYTQLSDVERELKNYRSYFKGKVVLCNCDDPYESNFFKYFAINFNSLGLKKLIAISYSGSPVIGDELPLFEYYEAEREPYKIEITQVTDLNNDGAIDLFDVELLLKNGGNVLSHLQGGGDFRSAEAIALLEEADVVVTNPPFSLFRDFTSQLVKHGKDFLIIGNQTAFSYAEIWPLFEQGKMWLGVNSGDMAFRVPDYFEPRETRYWQDSDGTKWRSMGNICWFTNIDHDRRHQKLPLFQSYDPEKYPKFDFYDAINVDKVRDIPADYFGAMAVPITFLSQHNPDQFDLVDANTIRLGAPLKRHGLIKDKDGSIAGKPKFIRMVIRRKDAN